MNGTLYGVSVGPGDPELLTLKALRVLRQCDVIAAPYTGAGEHTAFQIALAAAPELAEKAFLQLPMPMTRDADALEQARVEAVELLTQELERGRTIAFVVLGDVSIYSTYTYLHTRILARGFAAEMVPGVTSFCAAAARLDIALVEGNQPLHILPGSYDGVAEGLRAKGTKVLMKTGKAMPRVREELEQAGLLERAQLVRRCGMEGERVVRSLADAQADDAYFSLIIVK